MDVAFDFQFLCITGRCDCRYQAWLKYTTHPEQYIANMAGERYEHLRGNPCVHDLVRQDLFRRAQEQFDLIRHFRRKASHFLRRAAKQVLGQVLYGKVHQYLFHTCWILEDSLE